MVAMKAASRSADIVVCLMFIQSPVVSAAHEQELASRPKEQYEVSESRCFPSNRLNGRHAATHIDCCRDSTLAAANNFAYRSAVPAVLELARLKAAQSGRLSDDR